MRKIMVFILMLVMTSETTGLCQMDKVPALFSHFGEHQDRDGQISFYRFLSMHYWGEDLPDDDDEQEMQLPFKKVEVHSTPNFIVPEIRKVRPAALVRYISPNFREHNQIFYPDGEFRSPDRPPCQFSTFPV